MQGLKYMLCLMVGMTMLCTMQADAFSAVLVPMEEGIVLGDRCGQIYVHLQSTGALHVIVDKVEPEGVFRYYDAEMTHDGTEDETVYQMELSRCEYLIDSGRYASTYEVSIAAAEDEEAVYTASFVVKDADFEHVENTEYHFYVTLKNSGESGFELRASHERTEEMTYISEQIFVLHTNLTLKGDVDGDGSIGIPDATATLVYYAKTAAGAVSEINIAAADIDENGEITLSDATGILTYYAKEAAGMHPDWDEIIG